MTRKWLRENKLDIIITLAMVALPIVTIIVAALYRIYEMGGVPS